MILGPLANAVRALDYYKSKIALLQQSVDRLEKWINNRIWADWCDDQDVNDVIWSQWVTAKV